MSRLGVAARRGGAVRGSQIRAGRAWLLAAVALVGGAAGHVSPAAADEQPSILKAYGLDWIQRVRDDAWPQPKDQRPVICLLDTGVAITPDTPADDPNGPIVARLAIDGGSGLPQGTTFEHLHGTTMASVIAAPKNDWGTVGVFPQARIVSVRVTVDDATYITPVNMAQGARACRREAVALGVSISAVVMAESNYDQRESELDLWQAAADAVNASGGIFVAAAGNAADAALVAPIASSSVLSVSAGSDDLSRCLFASSTVSADLRGPGCSSETVPGGSAWPAGSSAAAAAVAALIGAIATRTPGEGTAARRARISEVPVDARSDSAIVDGTRFLSDFAGFVPAAPTLDTVTPVSSPAPVEPLPPAAPVNSTVTKDSAGAPSSATIPAIRTVLWRPTLAFRWSKGRLFIRRVDRRGGRTFVSLTVGTHVSTIDFVGHKRSVPLSDRPTRAASWAQGLASTWRTLTVRAKLPR